MRFTGSTYTTLHDGSEDIIKESPVYSHDQGGYIWEATARVQHCASTSTKTSKKC